MDNKTIEDAVRFISLTLKDEPETNRVELIEKASRKFDLNPLQTDFLMNKYVYNK